MLTLMENSRSLLASSLSLLFLPALWLFLLPTAAGDKTAADYFVSSLPGQPDGPLLNMHAGHIEVNPEHNGNLFFWHFQNKHSANRQRTVLWLNGGPGCSSMDGALMEIGPYRVTKDQKLTYNNGSWDEFANVLFVDNPVGTGFSYVNTDSYVHELTDMADQLVTFFEKWFAIFPEYEDNDLYIAGESYAGQHIPYLAKAILARNDLPSQKKKWNLSGLLIGNGWISPVEQYNAYLTKAYSAGIIEKDSQAAKELEQQHKDCINALQKPGASEKIETSVCEGILRGILNAATKNGRCPNMYDLRLTDTSPDCGMNWPPDLEQVKPYLRKPEVVQALHINPDKKSGWSECSGAVQEYFNPVKSKAAITFLPEIIERIPTILFSGREDLICNHMGTEDMIHNMEWNGGKGFELSPGTWAPRQDWTFEGEPAGFYQSARNLTYILFYNASHMVPFDYPRRSRDMFDRFMKVDIAEIGGQPVDSLLDGEKGVETSVGGHPNSTSAEQVEKEKLEEAKWAAYYKSGEVALIVVIILAGVWAWYVWRDRRRRAGYQGLFGGSTPNEMRSQQGVRDVEAADFDEAELDNLHADDRTPLNDERRYSLGGESSDEEEKYVDQKPANGHANGHTESEKQP